jgi:hypothetical protein
MARLKAPRFSAVGLALLALVAGPALGGRMSRSTQAGAAGVTDPPLLVPWSRIGDIALGESRKRVERLYGSKRDPLGFYRLHGGKVWVSYDGGRVADIGFTTRYYRTKSGFGVGSKIPLGPCHRTAKTRCEHRWRGFAWNAWVREKPCSCWVKVGLGARSLPATTANFLKPWFFIYIRHGRVTRFYFALKFVD